MEDIDQFVLLCETYHNDLVNNIPEHLKVPEDEEQVSTLMGALYLDIIYNTNNTKEKYIVTIEIYRRWRRLFKEFVIYLHTDSIVKGRSFHVKIKFYD